MIRPVKFAQCRSRPERRSQGYTLVEILVATTLTLILVAAVVKIFGDIGESMNKSRSTLEMSEQLRAAKTRLELDLAGITATMLPPLRPEAGEGPFEYIEGPVGPVLAPSDVAVNTDDPAGPVPDTTIGDFDDRLIFTTRSLRRPFLGRVLVKRAPQAGETADGNDAVGDFVLVHSAQSDVAEVAWFLRGRTLYRRVLLVQPQFDADLRTPERDLPDPRGFYANYDLSVHWDGSKLVPNALSDLTRRKWRYARFSTAPFPYDVRGWGRLGLPTLRECSSAKWRAGNMPPPGGLPADDATTDFWNDPTPWANIVDPVTGTLNAYLDGPRWAEDVILTNVIGFDVRAWDPGAPVRSDGTTALGPSDLGYQQLAKADAPIVDYGAYVDLGYAPKYSPPAGAPVPLFNHVGDLRSRLQATDAQPARVYDTWSFHYEHDGIDQDEDGLVDEGTNGFDDDNNGIVDDPGELETSAPYPVPLRAIQVKIRAYEPDSRQIREVTVVQEFLPK